MWRSRLAASLCLSAAALLHTCFASDRGTGWGFDSLADLEALGDLSWFYNWGTEIRPELAQAAQHLHVQFVPMQWSKWGVEDITIPPGSQHLLGFNEPTHRQQANLQPEEAAQLWPHLQDAARKHGLRLGTPAAAPCGADCVLQDPFEWWDRFFAACSDCHFDFLVCFTLLGCTSLEGASERHGHRPRTTTRAQQRRSAGKCSAIECSRKLLMHRVSRYMDACKRYGLPLWLTEFDCPNGEWGPQARQTHFMQQALALLDADADVERCELCPGHAIRLNSRAGQKHKLAGWPGLHPGQMEAGSGRRHRCCRLTSPSSPSWAGCMWDQAALSSAMPRSSTAPSAAVLSCWQQLQQRRPHSGTRCAALVLAELGGRTAVPVQQQLCEDCGFHGSSGPRTQPATVS